MKEQFIDRRFSAGSLAMIEAATQIIEEYQAQGFTLTLRQLYYQFVARDLLENTVRSYKRLGSVINDARLAGLVDWESIEDRTRNLQSNLRLDGPRHAVEIVRDQYGIDMWANQPRRVEVWIEKEALAGVISGICEELDVPYFACRGYVSQSEQWRAYRRFRDYGRAGQNCVILHFGDHDPSGIDMTRDNQDRLDTFMGFRSGVSVIRLALTMAQVEKYGPPPNPAKVTDSRFAGYRRKYGDESWELDALEPRLIARLIESAVVELRDAECWNERAEQLAVEKARLDEIVDSLA